MIQTTLTPRTYEMDALGHINNAVIAAWFEVGRVSFLESLHAQGKQVRPDWVLVAVGIDYRAETHYGEDVTVDVFAQRVGNSSLTLGCTMHQGGELKVEGEATLVYWDLKTRESLPIPDTLRTRVNALLDQA